MTGRDTLPAVLLALTLVLAGCGAPVAQSDGGTPETGTPSAEEGTATNDSTVSQQRTITVTNGSFSLDPNLVFERVQRLQQTSVDPPRVIQVYNSIEGFENQSRGVVTGPSRTFYKLAGMRAQEVSITESVTRQKNGYVTGLGSIVLYLGANVSKVEEMLLTAHEFTHYVQLQSGRQEQLAQNLGGITPTDKRYVLRAVIEGGAVVTTDAYLERYGNTTTTNSAMYTQVQSALPDGHIGKYENGKYVHGAVYMDSRSETPADLSAVYENPPQTSEQVLHGIDPETEPPTPLTVTVETDDEWVASGTDRMGEAFLRTALESAVGEQQAATAAAGWGNDTVRFLRPTDGSGETAYAWILRWDDAANQTEFQTTYEQSLDKRGTARDNIWSLDNSSLSATVTVPTDRSSVVIFGPEGLVSNVSVAGTTGEITVSTP